jgi:hypothetical protein
MADETLQDTPTGGFFDTLGIENFYDTVSVNDFARTNLFRVEYLGGTKFTQQELLYIKTTNIPGREITNIPVPFMGLQFNVPGTAKYTGSDNWQVTFRMPQNYSIRRKFEDWTHRTFNDQTSTGAYSIPNKNADNQIVIHLLDKMGGNITNRTYTLYGAYCRTLGPMNLDITASGEVLEQQVTLAYQYWRISR